MYVMQRFIIGYTNNRQYSWEMDEPYIKIKEKWLYLYRAINVDALALNVWLRKNVIPKLRMYC